MKQKRGFTLVELLVVVAIIAILSVIGLTVFSGAQSNARDARRKSDIEAIQNSIETTRTPGTVFYTSVPSAGFSAGTIPQDSTNAYCIRTTIAAGGVTDNPSTATGGSWASGTCPNTAATANETAWAAIPQAGLTFTASTVGWKACTKLEGKDSSSNPIVYCKPSSQ